MIHAVALALVLAPGAAQAPAADQPATAIASGRVVDAGTGRPIPGALVTAAGSAAVEATAGFLTNGAGHFVVRGLRNGSLALTAVKGGYVEGTYGQRRPAGSRQMIAVEDGQRIGDLEIRMWRHGVITGTAIDEAGEPVIGARVRAFQAGFIAARRRFTPAGEATTDDRGVYRIAHLVPGDYIVAAPSTQTSIPTEVMDAFYARAGTDALRARLSLEMRSIDAAIVPGGSEFAVRAGAITVPLPPGTATPTSRAGAMMIYPTVFHPAGPTAAHAGVVTIRSGEERGGIDLQLQPSRSARVSGALIAPDGMAAHVGVRLLPAGGEALVDEIETATAMTDSTGAFTFIGVPPGEYVLSVARVPRPIPDLADPSRMTLQSGSARVSTSAPPPPGSALPAPIPADATLWARVPIAVGAADLTDVMVPLRQGPRMSGRVEFEGSEALPPPSAVAGLRIALDPADGSAAAKGLSFETGHPDESGRFTTYGVPPGRYVVNVTGIVFPGWVFKGARYEGRDIADTPIEMSSADISGVVITLTDRAPTLAGVVTTNGSTDSAAIVLAFPSDPDGWASSGVTARRMKVARADRDGAYRFANLPAGSYYVAAVKDDSLGDWLDPALLRALSRVATEIHLGDGEQKRQSLRTVEIR